MRRPLGYNDLKTLIKWIHSLVAFSFRKIKGNQVQVAFGAGRVPREKGDINGLESVAATSVKWAGENDEAGVYA